MNWMQFLLILLVLPVMTSHAQVLNKCVTPSGAVSWQSDACAGNTRQMRSISYTPEVPTVFVATTQPATKAGGNARSRRASGYRISTRTALAPRDPCLQAKRSRESTLERVGLKRNYDLLSKLDADVRRVCR